MEKLTKRQREVLTEMNNEINKILIPHIILKLQTF